MFKTIVLAFAAATLAIPAAAQPGATPARPQAASELAVAISFAPPLGRPLRYRLVKTSRPGGQDRSIQIDFTVRFDRIEGGYAMTVDYNLAGSSPGNADDPAAALARPITVRLNAEGDIVAVEREAEYWAAVAAVIDTVAVPDGPQGERSRAMMRQLFGDLRALPDTERIAKVTENFAPILAASTVDIGGEPVRTRTQVATIFGPMEADVVLALERVTPDAAHLRADTSFPPGAFEAAIQSLVERLGAGGRAPPLGDFKVVGVEFSEQIEVARATGLTRRYRIARIIETEVNGERDRNGPTMTLELLTP